MTVDWRRDRRRASPVYGSDALLAPGENRVGDDVHQFGLIWINTEKTHLKTVIAVPGLRLHLSGRTSGGEHVDIIPAADRHARSVRGGRKRRPVTDKYSGVQQPDLMPYVLGYSIRATLTMQYAAERQRTERPIISGAGRHSAGAG